MHIEQTQSGGGVSLKTDGSWGSRVVAIQIQLQGWGVSLKTDGIWGSKGRCHSASPLKCNLNGNNPYYPNYPNYSHFLKRPITPM